ncbi:MAG: PhnA-like protein [Hyphomicrobiaceae bacterium]|nr:PhnA-like protein [Hyphomicrobiaceae bacterium]
MASIQPETAQEPARPRGEPDAAYATGVTPEDDMRTILSNRVCWGAVLAGVVLALATQSILNLIGIGLGASAFDPAGGANPSAASFSIGAGLWGILSGIISALVGGYAAGRLSGQRKQTGGWHGLTAWALSTLLMFAMLTTAIGAILGGAFWTLASLSGGATQAVGTAAQAALQAAAPGVSRTADPFASIEKAIRGASGGNDPAALKDAAVSAVRSAVTSDPAQAQDARERAVQALAKAQGVPADQARTQLGRYDEQYRQAINVAKEQAASAAQMAATAVSRGALFGSLALLLGALAAWLGGRMGAVEPTLTTAEATAARRASLH